MSRTRGSSRAVIETRRRWVQRYMLAGHDPEEIAEMVGVHRATVFRDIEAIRAKNLAELNGIDAQVLAAHIDQLWRHMMRMLSGLLQEHLDEPGVVCQVVRQQAELARERAELFQSLGLIYRAPMEVSFEQRLVRFITGLTPEQWAELETMDDAAYLNALQKQGLVQGPPRLGRGPEGPARESGTDH